MKIKDFIPEIMNLPINKILKEGMAERLTNDAEEYETMEELLHDMGDGQTLICELDVCLEYLSSLGYKTTELTPDEDSELEQILEKHLSDNLKDFPYDIMTEDYCLLYRSKNK